MEAQLEYLEMAMTIVIIIQILKLFITLLNLTKWPTAKEEIEEQAKDDLSAEERKNPEESELTTQHEAASDFNDHQYKDIIKDVY